jgi:hypothetical protein
LQKNAPIVKAALGGHKDTVQVLLKYGANVNATDECHNTLLHIAVQQNNTDLVRLLLSQSADCRRRNGKGLSALDTARLQSISEEIIVLLVEAVTEYDNVFSLLHVATLLSSKHRDWHHHESDGQANAAKLWSQTFAKQEIYTSILEQHTMHMTEAVATSHANVFSGLHLPVNKTQFFNAFPQYIVYGGEMNPAVHGLDEATLTQQRRLLAMYLYVVMRQIDAKYATLMVQQICDGARLYNSNINMWHIDLPMLRYTALIYPDNVSNFDIRCFANWCKTVFNCSQDLYEAFATKSPPILVSLVENSFADLVGLMWDLGKMAFHIERQLQANKGNNCLIGV